MKDIIVRDAEEFGVHVKMGGWRLGLLVARNVQPGTGASAGDNQHVRRSVSRETDQGKVSAREFAKAADTSAKRVLQYLAAWNEAADEGAVPHTGDLHPGAEPNIEFETLPDWNLYYSPVRAIDNKSPERRKAIETAATEAGTTPDQVNKALSSKPALAAAIKADPETAAAAMKALDERFDREYEKPTPTRTTSTGGTTKPDETKVFIAFRKVRRDLQAVADLIAAGDVTELSDLIVSEVKWLRNALELIEASSAGSLDDDLVALLSEEG